MDLSKLSKIELLEKCETLGIKNCKSKNKNKLIELLSSLSSSEKKHLKPLIKWSGGKSDEIKLFKDHFPENYDNYIEPFVGGGSVYFYLNPDKAIITLK